MKHYYTLALVAGLFNAHRKAMISKDGQFRRAVFCDKRHVMKIFKNLPLVISVSSSYNPSPGSADTILLGRFVQPSASSYIIF